MTALITSNTFLAGLLALGSVLAFLAGEPLLGGLALSGGLIAVCWPRRGW